VSEWLADRETVSERQKKKLGKTNPSRAGVRYVFGTCPVQSGRLKEWWEGNEWLRGAGRAGGDTGAKGEGALE
jgi:hypothetical protein